MASFSYVPQTSILTLLLSFTGLLLPRTTVLFTVLPPQLSSLDKPQYPFLVPITASPVWTLVWLCTGVGVCLGWWAGWMRVWCRKVHVDLHKLEALCNACINTLIASLAFHCITILFGAPITTQISHTYLLALLLALLTTFVPSYTLSLPVISSFLPGTQFRVTTSIDRTLVYPIIGSLIGAWAGAFPIPLDWDRPWQAWPLTPAYGALTGHITGAWSAAIVNTVLFFASAGREMQMQTAKPEGVEKKKKKKKKKGE